MPDPMLYRIRNWRVPGSGRHSESQAEGSHQDCRDIGSDLMAKIVASRSREDDAARNPGVIADCTGDNAGDSWLPRRCATALRLDGVTGVALITFILLGARRSQRAKCNFWCGSLVMRVMMLVSSALSPTSSTARLPRRSTVRRTRDELRSAASTSLVWLNVDYLDCDYLWDFLLHHSRAGRRQHP